MYCLKIDVQELQYIVAKVESMLNCGGGGGGGGPGAFWPLTYHGSARFATGL